MTGNRTFYVFTALFALGALGAQLAPQVMPAWLLLAVGVGLIPCWFLPALRPGVFLAAGVLWALFRAALALDTEWPAALERRDVTLSGTVASLPERNERYLKFDLDVERADFQGTPVAFSGRVRLRWYEPTADIREAVKAASTWRLVARLKQPHGYYNPGGFDYEAYLFRQGIRATGYVRDSPANARTGTAAWWLLSALRQHLRDRLEGSMAGLGHPGLLKALALGDRSGVTDSEWRTLRATGTNHLIAISGLHIGLVAAIGGLLGLWAGRLLAVFNPDVAAPRIAAGSALAMALLYAALSGFAVPAQRASVMAAVFLLGVLCRRHAWTVRGLCAALVVVLILDPAAVHDPGLWLSFTAVALIIGWVSRETGHRPAVGTARRAPTRRVQTNRPQAAARCHTFRGRILAAVGLQWVLSVALLPLVAAFFGFASLVAVPANCVAVPVVVFCLVPLCLGVVALSAVGLQGWAAAGLGLADTVMHGLWAFLSWLGELEYARVDIQLALWQSVVILAGVLWCMLARPGRRRWGLLGLAVLLAPGPGAPSPGAFRVAVLDVGQGLAVVVRTARHTLVYDTGARYPSGFTLARAVVVPYLRARGVAELDTVIVSHGDNDHRGGFETLRSRYPPRRILSSVAGTLTGAEYCVAGQRWRWDGIDFEILHPDAADPPPHNNASCVLRISGPNGSVLLTGDIESRAEAALVRRAGRSLSSEVLLVPHQGSETSSSPDFLDIVDPEWAIVSAGYRNQYGHPRPAVMARYRERGIDVRNTAADGAVIVTVSKDGIRFSGWRETRPRYWLDRETSAHGRDAI